MLSSSTSSSNTANSTSSPKPIRTGATSRASLNSSNHSTNSNNNTNTPLTSTPPVSSGGLSVVSSSHLALRHGNDHHDGDGDDDDNNSKDLRPRRRLFRSFCSIMSGTGSSMRLFVLLVLCLQNSMFTVLRRYSQGVLKEIYSKYEVLMVGEVIKLVFSAYMIAGEIQALKTPNKATVWNRLQHLCWTSRKMIVLALIYGAMNILSFVSLRNIGAGMFTIIAQCKILTTATFSTLLLKRHYSATKWRALIALLFGVLLFSEPVWGNSSNLKSQNPDAKPLLGVMAVVIEVTLSGFASIYFEKVIKVDSHQHSIWERNFQLAFGSIPVYLAFITYEDGGTAGLGGGWSPMAFLVSFLGAAGGLLVALSIKYGDAILKTLATTGAIILSSVLDHFVLGGPLTLVMCIAAVQVVLSICNYTFDATPSVPSADPKMKANKSDRLMNENDEEVALLDRDEKQGKLEAVAVGAKKSLPA